MCVYLYNCTSAYLCVCVCLLVYVYVCVFARVCVCVCVFVSGMRRRCFVSRIASHVCVFKHAYKQRFYYWNCSLLLVWTPLQYEDFSLSSELGFSVSNATLETLMQQVCVCVCVYVCVCVCVWQDC